MIITTIAGAPGVGKTALAVRWAHRVAERFADGQLYVNLRGYDARQQLQPIEAPAHLLRCLGVQAERLPVDLEGASAMYRSMLAGRRMLNLLDNARSAEQVRSLLPGYSGNLVLVTSRENLSGLVATEGAQRMTLGLLDVDDAVALIRGMIGEARAASATHVLRLVEVCGRLPLALRIAATHLADRPDITVEAYVDELAGDRLSGLTLAGDGHRGLRTVLDQSFRALPADARRAFASLGVFPGADFTTEIFAPLAGCGNAEAASILDELESGHLVQRLRSGRYALHDLVREYASDVFEQSGIPRQEPLSRLFAALEQSATQAHARIDYQAMDASVEAAGSPTLQEAMSWLDAERFNLAAAISGAAELGWDDQAQAIAKALWMYFYHAGYTVDWITTFEAAFEAMSVGTAASARYYVLNALGSAYIIAGQYDQAMRAHRECIAAREKMGDEDGVARSRSNLAISLCRLCRFDEALAELEIALDIYRRRGDRAMEAFVRCGNISDCLTDLGRFDEAVEHIQHALAILADGKNPFAQGRALQAPGEAYVRMERPELALQPLEQSLELCRSADNHRLETLTTSSLGMAYGLLGQYDRSLELLNRSLESSRQMGLALGECTDLYQLGRVYSMAGKADQAKPLFEAALELSLEHNLPQFHAMALSGLGSLLRDTDPDAARAQLKTAIDMLERASYISGADRVRREWPRLSNPWPPDRPHPAGLPPGLRVGVGCGLTDRRLACDRWAMASARGVRMGSCRVAGGRLMARRDEGGAADVRLPARPGIPGVWAPG